MKIQKLSLPRVDNAFIDLKTERWRNYAHRNIPSEVLPARDVQVLRSYADEIAEIAEECLRNGRISDRAADLIDMHSNEARDRIYNRLFGEQPVH